MCIYILHIYIYVYIYNITDYMYICNSDAIIALIKLFIIYFHCELHHVVEETETLVFALLRMMTIQA